VKQHLVSAGVAADAADKLAGQVLQNGADPIKVQGVLTQGAVPMEPQLAVMKLVEEQVGPTLRAPALVFTQGRLAQSRFASAFVRSLVLSLFVLLWFFIVPVPGLFVFTAREYRISVELGTICSAVFWGIGLTVTGYWLGLLIEHLRSRGVRGRGLVDQADRAYRRFQEALSTGTRLSNQEISHIYALFTDLQTYLDQRSYEYVQRSLVAIERKLTAARRAGDLPAHS
jgi:hypothetical protein